MVCCGLIVRTIRFLHSRAVLFFRGLTQIPIPDNNPTLIMSNHKVNAKHVNKSLVREHHFCLTGRPSAASGSHISQTGRKQATSVRTNQPRLPSKNCVRTPTAYKLVNITGMAARTAELTVNARALVVART